MSNTGQKNTACFLEIAFPLTGGSYNYFFFSFRKICPNSHTITMTAQTIPPVAIDRRTFAPMTQVFRKSILGGHIGCPEPIYVITPNIVGINKNPIKIMIKRTLRFI